jgi:hypothetical protein
MAGPRFGLRGKMLARAETDLQFERAIIAEED